MGSLVVDSTALRLGIKAGYGTISAVSNTSAPKRDPLHNGFRPSGLRADPACVGLLSVNGAEPTSTTTTTLPSTLIPFSRDHAFVDRPDILEQIDERCSGPGGRAVLVGQNGIGKKESAEASITGGGWVSWILADDEPADAATCVFWIQANTLATITEGFVAIAEAVGIQTYNKFGSEIIQTVCRWLGNERLPVRWLLVFDGADNSHVFLSERVGNSNATLESILPTSPRGSVLFTTCDRSLAVRLASPSHALIDVGPMKLHQAILLLEKKMSSSYGRLGTKADLVEELDLIPLTITQAAFHIRSQRHMTPDTYLQALREGDAEIVKMISSAGDDGRRGLLKPCSALDTWLAKFLQVRATYPSAADLLCLLSFYDGQDVHETLVDTPVHIESSEDKKPTDEGSSRDTQLSILYNYCLISRSQWGGIQIPRMVQLSVKTWLKENGELNLVNSRFVARLDAAFTRCLQSTDDADGLQDRLIPHAEKAVVHPPQGEEAQLTWASMLHKSALYQMKQGRFYGAEQHAALSSQQYIVSRGISHDETRAALETFRETLKHLQPQPGLLPLAMDAATSILGGSTRNARPATVSQHSPMDRLTEAEALLSHTLNVYQQTLGEEDQKTLECAEELATAHARQGKLLKAEQSFLHVIETRKRVLGEKHASSLISMRRMASEILWSAGHESEAREMLTHVLQLHEEALGPEDDDTATCMYDLAGMLGAHGQYARSEALLRRVVAVREKTRGADHLLTLTSMSDLAGIFGKQARWEEAEEILPGVIKGKESLLGGEHGDAVVDMQVLAEVYMAQSRWQEAEALLVKVVDGQTEMFGANHDDTVVSEEMIYEVRRKLGSADESADCQSDVRAGSGAELHQSRWFEDA
ncbi:kinesin light chain [Verticillium alfalfae VaMs.102]|uniref:Kinesin light chain n=1 Tax=Verticillium alfalfae (strain VaMs.102 / ATCC MYA-4576 / FGSC 10136) TaxID=526221 RepID=C9SKJ4_VERA1|nr:kinesin light chain [Verticillium alfalfae VaMs.102]EEY19212.1 kinesin light chain [Verticillium alfalfae VaMs.102]